MKRGIPLLKVAIPVIIIILLFNVSKLAGFIGIVVYLAYTFYAGRSNMYAMQGKNYYEAGDMKKAAEYYGKACQRSNVPIALKSSYAYILLKSGETDKANEVLKPLLNMPMKSEEEIGIKSNYALVQWKNGDIDGAVETMEKLLEKYKNTLVYENLGYFLILKGDLNRALEVNLQAYQFNNEDKIITDNLGQNYYLMGEHDKAEETYEKLMKKNPQFPEPYYYYGCILADEGKYDEALSILEKGISYKFSPLSTVAREQMEDKINELKERTAEKEPEKE